MARLRGAIKHLRQSILVREMAEMTDGQLLECYLARHDEIAFEAIVQRHGPMVMSVCHRVLRNHHDAEDAFQATFLVLARKASSIVPRGLVANWLYGVAYRTALKARAMAGKRLDREKKGMEMPKPEGAEHNEYHSQDLLPLLDDELSRLPEKYRVPIVLCDLEAKTRREAADQLGWSEGTLSGRLARARKMLAERLARRGVVLSGGLIATVLSQNSASACVPTQLVDSTVQAASLYAAGQVATGVISAKVAALTEGVLKTMLVTKLKIASAVVLTLCLVGSGVGLTLMSTTAAEPTAKKQVNQVKNQNGQKDDGQKGQKDDGQKGQKDDGQKGQKDDGQQNQKDDGQQNQAVVKDIDPVKNLLTVSLTRQGKVVDQTYTMPKNVRVVISGKPGNLVDLKPGMKVGLNLSEDKKEVVGIRQMQIKQDK